ncbi:MAG: ATP-binding protein [Candidatus Pacebacteria bacterium]|nr:ATP-binding protein [Candidatus Paceibacterota bacterium]
MNKSKIKTEELANIKENLSGVQQYFDDLSDFIPVSFLVVNPLHLILEANPFFTKLSGYEEIDIIGSSIEDFFLEKKEINLFKKKILSSRDDKNEVELTFTKKDGEQFPVSVSTFVRKDKKGKIFGYFLTIVDITDSKNFKERIDSVVSEKTKELESKNKEVAESRLALMNILEETDEAWKNAEEEKEKTASIIANFTDGLLVFDKNDCLDMGNPKAEKFLRTNLEKLVGKYLKDLNGSDLVKAIVQVLLKNEAFQKDKKSSAKVKAAHREEVKTGDGQTLEVSAVPIIADKTSIGTLVSLHDITREKMIEAMKSEFVSIAAHQLRTPLSGIKWTIRMLVDGDLGKISKDQKEMLEKTYESNERMIHLVNDLLNVSRIEEGRYVHKPEMVDISKIIEPLAESYKMESERREIKLKLDIVKKKNLTVAADVEKITLVAQNLLENALKYTPKGGEITFSVKHKVKDNKIEVSVKDSGVGIPKDQQARLFTKFFRAANVVRMEVEGSGLGLFICKNIVESHGGEIWFKSEENKGSTFYFTLPIVNEQEFEEFKKKL